MPASRPLTIALVVLAAAGLLLGGTALAMRPSGQPAIEVKLPVPSTTPADGRLMVYVAGAVAHPGVYPFSAGDRVADAVAAAGGPAGDADLSAINYARRLRDEDQVTVPRRGESPTLQVGVGGVPAASGRRIDLNTASAASLEALPGIGTTRAQRIVESRVKDGPFADPSDLVKRKIIPQSILDGIIEFIETRS